LDEADVQVLKMSVTTLALLVISAAVAPSLNGQSLVSGDITGTVVDPTAAVLVAVKVTLRNTATGETRTTATNGTGVYRFAFVAPGNYILSVQAAGFTTATKAVVTDVGRTTISDFKLNVGSNAETVKVKSAELVQADTADMSTTFGSGLIQDLPNPGNDLTYIAQTAPGVNMNSSGAGASFQAYGLPSSANLFTVNGQNAMEPYTNSQVAGASNLMLGRNETQEATVTTNAYSGQFGQQAGVQVNYVTKSGTNQFHGNVVYWWTGRALDANDWFNNHTTPKTPRPFANNNEWAGSLGGPIKKDKLFFFVDNEGITYIVPTTTTVFSPSPQFANATLNNLAAVSPSSVPLYSKMFQLYQSAPGYNTATPVVGDGCQDFTPTFSGPCFVQYQANPAEPALEWMLVGRVDVNFSDVDKIFARVSLDHGTQATYADPINSAFNVASYQPLYNGQAQWTHVFGSSATNSFIMAGSYYRFLSTQKNAAATFPVVVNMSGLGYTSMANNENMFPSGHNGTQYQFIDDYSLIKGNHSLKFGGNWRRYDYSTYDVSLFIHPTAFVNSVTQFYNGEAVAYGQNFSSRTADPAASWGMGLYAQDEWRARKNLKLTLALRVEKNSNPVCQTNCASRFNGPFYSQSTDPNTPYNTTIAANQHQVFPATDKINWAPRFGFAWSPGGSGKTVVRGGFGLFYDSVAASLSVLYMMNPPNVVSITLCCTENWADTTSAGAGAAAASSAAAIKNGFINGASFSSLSKIVGANFSAPNFNSFLGTLHTPQYQEWSLQIEQQLDSKSSLSFSYVGNHGIHIPIDNTPNLFGSGLANIPSSPYNPSFAYINEFYSGVTSNYNGATVAYDRRLTYGFALRASYTWGHALDEVSNGGLYGYGVSGLPFQINPFCLACDNYGNADYDIRNSFNAAYTWQIPFSSRRGVANHVLSGWTFAQNFFARSGLPFTVFDNTTYLTNYGTIPAQVISNSAQMSCQNGNSQCLNPAAFETATAYGAFPTQTRNLWRGPAFFDSDFSLYKNLKLTERFAFQIGANLYNVFNHPNFINPNSSLSSFNSNGIGEPGGNFGVITRTTAPPTTPYGAFFAGLPSGRIIQIQSKIVF
jgi:hypothetical protein